MGSAKTRGREPHFHQKVPYLTLVIACGVNCNYGPNDVDL